jgi:hypothetical protein
VKRQASKQSITVSTVVSVRAIYTTIRSIIYIYMISRRCTNVARPGILNRRDSDRQSGAASDVLALQMRDCTAAQVHYSDSFNARCRQLRSTMEIAPMNVRTLRTSAEAEGAAVKAALRLLQQTLQNQTLKRALASLQTAAVYKLHALSLIACYDTPRYTRPEEY